MNRGRTLRPVLVCLALLWSPGVLARPSCPADLPTLSQQLMRDLPGYANRAYARRNLGSQLLLLSRPEFEPLPTGPGQLVQGTPPPREQEPQQIFLGALERVATPQGGREVEQYHWLFLTRSAGVWRLALLFTRTAARDNSPRLITPPRDSSGGPLAEAIRTWLRDCQLGALRDQPLARPTPAALP